MFGDVDLFALDEPRLERFGQHSPAGKPANELHPGLATTIGAALVDRDLGHEVAITPGDRQPLIYAGQDLLAIRDAAPIPCLLGRARDRRFGDIPGDIRALSAVLAGGIRMRINERLCSRTHRAHKG
jgi:hypothetical protein